MTNRNLPVVILPPVGFRAITLTNIADILYTIILLSAASDCIKKGDNDTCIEILKQLNAH